MDGEDPLEKIPYPKQVFFLFIYNILDDYAGFGGTSIIALYIRDVLDFTESQSKMIFHGQSIFGFFLPLIGSIIADNYTGRYNMIFYGSVISIVGSLIITASTITPLHLPKKEIYIGVIICKMFLTAGIGPCITPIGADQYTLPQHNLYLSAYFAILYFNTNVSAFLSTLITPIQTHAVQCFGDMNCYLFSFGTLDVFTILALTIFAIGKRWYKEVKPTNDLFFQQMKCIKFAVAQGFKKDRDPVEHWMDRAESKFDKQIINDIKQAMSVLIIYIPLPFYWALYDQQNTAFIFLATRLDGDIGFTRILPEHIQIINPLEILILIPIFTYGVYPLLAKCGLIKTCLQRMSVGGFIAAFSYILVAFISYQIEEGEPVLPDDNRVEIRFFNPTPCLVKFEETPYFKSFEVLSMDFHKIETQLISDDEVENVKYTYIQCGITKTGEDMNIVPNNVMYYYFTDNDMKGGVEDITKSENGKPKARILTNAAKFSIEYIYQNYKQKVNNDTMQELADPGHYKINDFPETMNLKTGQNSAILVQIVDNDKKAVKAIEIVPPNSVHLLALSIPITIIAISEIMFSVTSNEFSYTEAPMSMKSLMQAMYGLTMSFGDIIIVIIEAIHPFERDSMNLLVYASLMFIDMFVFVFLAMRYKYQYPKEDML